MSEELVNFDGMSSSGNGRDIKRFKITEGSHVFRILPPFGTNHGNVPSRQVQLHWGFFKEDGKTSPVPCSYPTEGYCPICERVKEREALAERSKAQGNEEEANQILKDVSQIKVKRTYLMNASNKAGEVGILEVTKTSIDGLIKHMKAYQTKYGKNPVSLATGVWFVFSRSGKGFNTSYEVELNKNMVTLPDGDQVEKVDNSALAANILENYEKLAYDIHKMYAPVSSADLKRILNGEHIDKVIVKKTKDDAAAPAASTSAAPQAAAAPTPASAPKVTASAAAPLATVADDQDDIMSLLGD